MQLGISLRRQSTRRPQSMGAAADVVLRDHTGAEVGLGSLWSRRPAVLVFLRHFG